MRTPAASDLECLHRSNDIAWQFDMQRLKYQFIIRSRVAVVSVIVLSCACVCLCIVTCATWLHWDVYGGTLKPVATSTCNLFLTSSWFVCSHLLIKCLFLYCRPCHCQEYRKFICYWSLSTTFINAPDVSVRYKANNIVCCNDISSFMNLIKCIEPSLRVFFAYLCAMCSPRLMYFCMHSCMGLGRACSMFK